MDMVLQIAKVYQRALLLRQHATASPVQASLLDQALQDLTLVLEELETAEEELQTQHQTLLATRQQVEAERQRYEDLFNLAPDGYLVTNSRGIIQEGNAMIATMLGVPQDYLTGKPLSVFIPDTTHSDFFTTLAQFNQRCPLGQTQTKTWELQICPHQRWSPLDVAITLSMTRYALDEEMTYRWSLRDITEPVRARILLKQHNDILEKEVWRRTEQLQQVLDREVTLKRITDRVRDDLDEQYCLQVVVQELAQSLEVLGCVTTIYDGDQDQVITQHQSYRADQPIPTVVVSPGYRQVLQGQTIQACELIGGLSASGEGMAPTTSLTCPIFDERSAVMGGLHGFKAAFDTFNASETWLVQQVANQCTIAIRQARLYKASQQQVQELEQLHQLKDTFLSTVSHELRTPLSNMTMAIHMLALAIQQPERFTDNSSRIARYLDILQTQCHQETSLINDLLDISRIEANAQPLFLSTIDVTTWLQLIVESFADRMQQQQQQLHSMIPADLPDLTTDVSVLKRVVIELIHNACKYTPAHEEIVIEATATEQALHLSISNSGVTIAPQELSRLFEAFYRVPTHDRWQHGGTGLGLALVKQNLNRLHGTIAVSNSPPWLVFTAQLPWILSSDPVID